MKVLNVYSIFFTLALAFPLLAKPPKLFISKSIPQVQGISLGSNLGQVHAKFGKPIKSDGPHADDQDTCGTGPWMQLDYQGMIINLNQFPKNKHFTVTQLRVTSPKWTFSPGVRVGMSFERVQKLFPTLVPRKDPDGNPLFWDEPVPGPGGFEIHFRDGVVDYICLFLELC